MGFRVEPVSDQGLSSVPMEVVVGDKVGDGEERDDDITRDLSEEVVDQGTFVEDSPLVVVGRSVVSGAYRVRDTDTEDGCRVNLSRCNDFLLTCVR